METFPFDISVSRQLK